MLAEKFADCIEKKTVLVMLFNAYMMRHGTSYPRLAQMAKIWASLICLKSISIGLLGSQEDIGLRTLFGNN